MLFVNLYYVKLIYNLSVDSLTGRFMSVVASCRGGYAIKKGGDAPAL
jgi:hypothetical protein